AVQGDLQASTQREPVDEGESRYRRLAEPPQNPVTELGHREGLFVAADQLDPLEVGAGSQNEWLAGHADRADVLDRERLVQGSVQGLQTGRAQRVRLAMVVSVVQGHQGRTTGSKGQVDRPRVG